MENKSSVCSISGSTFVFLIASVFLSVLSVLLYETAFSSATHHAAILFGSLAIFNILPRWIYAMIFEILALIVVLFIGLFHIRRLVAKPIGRENKTPILLVHGFCNDAGVWIYFRRKLAKHYKGPIYTMSLRAVFSPIEEHAITLKKRIDQILQETASQSIILIGHSMGGLVSSYTALGFVPKQAIRAIITIGTPFHGSYAAYLALGKNGRQMRYGSPFTTKLCKDLETSAIPIYQIATLTDELIIPARSAFLNTPQERQHTIPNVGHAAMLFSPRVVSQVLVWLSSF